MRKALLIVGAVILLAACGDSEEKQRKKMAADALYLCQEAIVAMAKFEGAERPPYVEPELSKSAALYKWKRGAFHFQNGFGVKEPQLAECVATKDEILFLRLNDETLINK